MFTQERITDILAFNRSRVRLNTEDPLAYSGLLKDRHPFVCLLNGCNFSRKLGDIIKIAKEGSKRPACTVCKPSMFFRERWARFICEQLVGGDFPNTRPDFLRPSPERRLLELDGFCEELNLAFEYQGEQHYRPIGKQTQTDFENQKTRDREKKTLCDEREIKLILIKYANEASEIERQIKKQLEAFKVQLVVATPDWSKYVMEGNATSEEKARIHSKLMDYKLKEPAKNTNSDSDFVFVCNRNVTHKKMQVKKIVPGKRPACRDCSYEITAGKNRVTHTPEQLIASGKKCNPKMLLEEWAGQNEKLEWLFKCSDTECSYIWAYSGKKILDGGNVEANVCINCKPAGKPRVQFWEVAKVAFELGGKCDHLAKITKKTNLTLHCHNAKHESFNLTVSQLLDSDMWCDLSPCNESKGKINQLKSSQVKDKIEQHYKGLTFISEPPNGQSGLLDVACSECGKKTKPLTYRKLRIRAKLKCEYCSKELGRGWGKSPK